MRSRVKVRALVEHVLRGIVIAALAVILWQSLREPTDSGGETLRTTGVGELADWSALSAAPAAIPVQIDSVPKPSERAWLGALAGAGTRVTWSGDVPPAMIHAQPVASPTGGTRVSVAALRGSSVIVSDDAGAIDTAQTQFAGVTFSLGSAAGELRARVKGSTASTVQRDSLVLKKLLVIGSAGWESKFIVAALEEEGWKVDAFIRVAPGIDVTQGSAAIDTSRYSAVIALDGVASPYANRIIAFARTGGGVVLTPQSASIDALSPLRVDAVGRANASARPVQAPGSVTLSTLLVSPIVSSRSAAAVLETRAGSVTAAARRIGAGRALQLDYEDIWRWRMSGGEGALGEHRVWWTKVVSAVAYAPTTQREPKTETSDGAPMVGLVASVGHAPPAGNASGVSGAPSLRTAWLFGLLAFAVVGEMASRRLRGAS